ncbi:MmcQ/YjbR family DNA-binding protein [Phenylobacterium sp. NIBR 498073]|uniref:MmcQ/YjbR family DNA-binding protein n=1 Tax=Phenylobacterium sp. NIBR 498073 TaxID=3015177 RepID=UPI0022B35D41|nr:MmcQ/YjbR family DNA-binding protein [Phenylobacterium sp. NIBR 498073]WGU40963.1 MmcQ/YjbR family DNA-binding protein [Phenylobacterium sp. NIBR 498073]
MTRQEVEAIALGLPAATRVVQWGGADVYKVGGKVFAICGLAGGLSFKVTEIGFMVLTDEGGPGRQAPYLAKGSWVIVDLDDAEAGEVAGWIATSHDLIAAKLTRKARSDLGL